MTKSLPLRDLLRQPAKVKKLTAAGHSVRVTDRGRRLWIVNADHDDAREGADAGASRVAMAWETALSELESELAAGAVSGPTAAQLLLEERRLALR